MLIKKSSIASQQVILYQPWPLNRWLSVWTNTHCAVPGIIVLVDKTFVLQKYCFINLPPPLRNEKGVFALFFVRASVSAATIVWYRNFAHAKPSARRENPARILGWETCRAANPSTLDSRIHSWLSSLGFIGLNVWPPGPACMTMNPQWDLVSAYVTPPALQKIFLLNFIVRCIDNKSLRPCTVPMHKKPGGGGSVHCTT
jgi:hypothetical protein